jgi:hypothetical protein
VSSLSPLQRRDIDLAKEDLVEAAETLLNDAKVKPSREFGHSQFRNLVAVAMETQSPAVVLNFIRYQMGRDDKNKNWSQSQNGVRLGDRFLTALHGQEGVVEKALARVSPDPGGDPVVRQLARMELIRYFLGFSTRYMKYLEI